MDLSRIGPICGCLSSVTFTLSWVISALLFGEWELGTDSLSSLGICGVASAEILFNFGCSMTGFFVIFLSLALFEDRGRWFRYSGVTAFICAIACLGIGSVNEGYGGMHNFFAAVYGLFAAATIALSGAGFYVEGKKYLTIIAAALLIISGISSLIHPFGTFEPIGISSILIWTFLMSAMVFVRNVREEVSPADH